MQWIEELEDAVDAAEGSAVFVVALPRIRNMQIRLGIQGMQHVADVLISRVKNYLRASCGYQPFARFSGMEVIIAVPGLMRLGEISALGERIRQICNEPMALDGERYGLDSVVGIAISPDDGVTAKDLVAKAQIAADNASLTHARGPIFFAGPMAKVADLACRIEMDLRLAIENRALSIVFQPQFDIANSVYSAAEVLVRWDHPVYGIIPPGDFIPIAESAGLVSQLGSLVLHESVIQMNEFRRDVFPLDLAVNVSPSQLVQEDFIYEIDDLLRSVGMPAKHLMIEITEGELIFDIDMAIHQLAELRRFGVRTSIDDFGAGFSNLAYLHRLPLDQIKIDRRFVQHLNSDPRSITLLRSSIELGRGLGLEVCVEGVESQRQLEILQQMGCNLVQGYLFAKPTPITELKSVVASPLRVNSEWSHRQFILN